MLSVVSLLKVGIYTWVYKETDKLKTLRNPENYATFLSLNSPCDLLQLF